MWKTSIQLRRYWKSHWGPVAGIVTGLVIIAVQLGSPHAGEPCGRLGEVVQEWRIALPQRRLMCVATVEGQLVYGRPIVPPKNKDLSLSQL